MSHERPTESPVEESEFGEAERRYVDLEDLYADLTGLVDRHGSTRLDEEVRDVEELLAAAHARGIIDSGVRRLRATDVAEAFVGSVIFASPLLIEDGVFDIGDYLFGFTVAGVPVFLIANTLFVLLMTYALLEWTGRNREETHLVLGRIPARLVMILSVSFVVAALLMTVWGRVGDWDPAIEAVARINVLWTVGSIGAALGDILSDGDGDAVQPSLEGRSRPGEPGSAGETSAGAAPARSAEDLSDGELVTAINDEFADLESVVDSGEGRREVRRIRERTARATLEDGFGEQIRKYTGRDIAEGFVGSVVFSIPFLVEDGVYDVADYFLSFRIEQFPVFFLVNIAFVLLMVLALVYWAGPQDVQMSRPLFGFIPRRLVGISVVSFLTAAALMTMWGRVGDWQDPVVAVARISVVWTVASFGAALGDILPGESSGDDINDDLADLGEMVRDLDDVVDRREG